MRHNKALYGVLGGVLLLVVSGITYLVVGKEDAEPFDLEPPPSKEVERKAYKEDLDKIKNRQALVKAAVGDSPKLQDLATAIENRSLDEQTRVALVQTLIREEDRQLALKHMMRLLGVLTKPVEDGGTREAIVHGLGRFIGFERARYKLIECLSPPTLKGERLMAMVTIGECSADWIKPHLEPIASNDPDDAIREQARKTLILIAKRSVRKRPN